MKFLLLLMYHICSTYVFANNDAHCNIFNISDGIWQGQLTIDIGDNQIDQPIFTSKYDGTIDHISCTNMKEFFAVENTLTDFIIKTTTNMESFDEDTAKTYRTFSTEIFKCVITCNQSPKPSTLNILVKITDINTHPPNFYQQDYTFLVPSPLMPLTDFSIYGSPIMVKDLDFSNQDVSFTVDPDDFDIKTRTSADSKLYTALFFTRNPIQINEDVVYKITATDSGDNPHKLSSTATITLKSNPSSSIDFPSFQKQTYVFFYSEDKGPKLTLKEGSEITVQTNKPKDLSDKSFSMHGVLSEYFVPVYNPSSQTVTLNVKKIYSEYTILIYTLTVRTDNIGSTSIVVYMPYVIFENNIHVANYNQEDKTITVEPAIKLQYRIGTPVIKISGDNADYFQILYNNITESYDLSLSEGHSIEDLGNIGLCKLQLTATLGESVSKAELLLYLPKHELKFNKPLYIGSYDSIGNNIDFDTDNLIKFVAEDDNVDISVDQEYTDYFSVHYNSTEQTYDFKLIAELPKNILEVGKDIIMSIKAEDKYENNDKSYVKIVLPLINSLLKFDASFYEVDYPSSGSGSIDLPIKFINPKNLSQVSVIPASDDIDATQYFSIEKQESDQFLITMINKLPDEIIQRPNLVFKLVASMSYAKSTSILVMNMPTKVKERAIAFQKLLYTGTLKDGKLSVNKIDMITNEADSKVWTRIEESKYSKYFQAWYKNKELTLSLKKSAPEKELRAIRSTLLTISVGINETTDQTSAVLSIESSIPDNIESSADDNKGAYVVTVWVLAVALVVFVIGSAAFYKLKISNQPTSHNVDLDDVGYMRFDKNKTKQSSGSSERQFADVSQRRPTRFFNPLNDEIAREINDDTEARERRKSVAFDEIVQKLQIETTNQEGDHL